MDIVQYEEYLEENNIHVIPSSYWESDYPDSYTLIKPFDLESFQKNYTSTYIDAKRTFNITFLFQKEEYYDVGDTLALIKYILKSRLTEKYPVTFKFNYDPHPNIIKTMPMANIKYVGQLPKDEYYGLLQNSHLICSNHRTNYSGRYLAEAAMFSVPILSSPSGGSMQFLTDDNSLFFKTKNMDGPENFVPCEECYAGLFELVEKNYNNLIRFAYRCRAVVSRMYSPAYYADTLKYIKEATEL